MEREATHKADSPLVSVVIAVKDGERYLTSAIDSVLEQEYRPIEVVVVDGQSADGTAKIAKSFPEVKYVLQTDKGISNAYNLGIDTSVGEFIAFISHDDLWTAKKLRLQVNCLVNNPEVQYTLARVKYFLEPGIDAPLGFRKELLVDDHVGYMMETLVARRALFDVVGRFNPDVSTAEDVDWFSRAKDHGVTSMTLPQVRR